MVSPLVVCGPSGVGKGTILKSLASAYSFLATSISHTTRAPRDNEIHGRDYYFVSQLQFNSMLSQQAFIEYAQVHGNLYGTSIQEIQRLQNQGKLCVLEIDVQGAQQIRAARLDPEPRFMFIAPPSMPFLEKRIRGRGTESEEKIKLRMKNAQTELDFVELNPDFFDFIIVHEELEFTIPKLEEQLARWYPELFKKH